MEKGDLLLIPFPFTDLSGSKNRPALVLVNGEIDVTLAFISTQLKWKEDTDVILKPTKENGLKTESIIRLSKLATIDKELAIGKLGEIDTKTRKQVNKNLIEILRLNEYQ
jgi:mRNA interferase MazF